MVLNKIIMSVMPVKPMKQIISDIELEQEPGANATLEDYDDPTDPKRLGPGYWNYIHRKAFDARDRESQLKFIQDMKYICHGFFCTKCRSHCTEYIETHPMEEYLDVTVEVSGEKHPIGLFLWAWRFHNAVNERLKKPIMNFNTAYNLYSGSDDMVCGMSCLESDITDTQDQQDTDDNGIVVHEDDKYNSIDPTSKNKYIPVPPPNPFRLIPIYR